MTLATAHARSSEVWKRAIVTDFNRSLHIRLACDAACDQHAGIDATSSALNPKPLMPTAPTLRPLGH